MLFNSFHFLVFFPLVVLVYFVLPHRLRWVWLLVASYYFYMAWNPVYALLMATSTAVTYTSGLLLARTARVGDAGRRKARRKLWVALSFGVNLGILFFFKYFAFAFANLGALLGRAGIQLAAPGFDILLPVGISFYTFQALGYTVDVYRGEAAERNFFRYALFVSFFPQLVAGPIERSKNLLAQIHERHSFDFDRMRRGLLLMLWGLFQKVVVADRIAIFVNRVFDEYTRYAGFEIAVATVLFAFQIYCDFSGYSDIAIGAAQVMGFRLMDNFRQPYFALSIGDFWRRWHISLSTWFRDYLYIPLGGSRCGRLAKYRNWMLTFLASGLWHGASWNYVIWGALHGAYQIVGDLTAPGKKRLYRRLGVHTGRRAFKLCRALVTFALVDFAWIFFRAPGARSSLAIIGRMFSAFNPWVLFDGTLYGMGLSQKGFGLMLLCIGLLLVVNAVQRRVVIREVVLRQSLPVRWLFYYAAIFAVLLFGVYGPGYDAGQFIYFQF